MVVDACSVASEATIFFMSSTKCISSPCTDGLQLSLRDQLTATGCGFHVISFDPGGLDYNLVRTCGELLRFFNFIPIHWYSILSYDVSLPIKIYLHWTIVLSNDVLWYTYTAVTRLIYIDSVCGALWAVGQSTNNSSTQSDLVIIMDFAKAFD